MPFKDIPQQNHEVWPQRLNLRNSIIQPLLAQQRAKVQIGHGN